MKQIIVKLRDNTEIRINKEYVWHIIDELNDTRTNFINIEDHIFAKDTIASVVIEELVEIPGEENEQLGCD